MYVTTTYPHEHNLRAIDAYASPSIKNPGVIIATGYGASIASSSARDRVAPRSTSPSGNSASGDTSTLGTYTLILLRQLSPVHDGKHFAHVCSSCGSTRTRYGPGSA